ncbi:hypothetical protein A2U01_0074027, partial [Trifolium medium]|nr:hypothetical protein [Trifolium medium]
LSGALSAIEIAHSHNWMNLWIETNPALVVRVRVWIFS